MASRGVSRRTLLGTGALATAAIPLLSPFEALAGKSPAPGWEVRPDGVGYGPLEEVLDDATGLPLLKLPRGFRYRSMGWTGDPMSNGASTPGGHDGGAALAGPGALVHYVRNHELRFSSRWTGPFNAPTYDAGQAPGGTTTLVFNPNGGYYVRTDPSLSGTIRNCAGGPTPWNSWLTCEENLDEPGIGLGTLQQKHGYIFEVPSIGTATAQPMIAMGRFNHEALAVDPTTGFVYETEDRGQSGLYRFIPNAYGQLGLGGKLQMLKVKGFPQLDTSTGMTQGAWMDVEWVDIAVPDKRDHNPGDTGGVFRQGFDQGGASIRRGEGAWYGNGHIYFISTSGGDAGEGQVWELDPLNQRLRLLYESPDESTLDNPDNVAVSPRGGLVLCEDGDLDGQYMRGLGLNGDIFPLARNNVVLAGQVNGINGDFRGSEWAGASFTPCGRWLIANIQTPGITFAITGPWASGVL